MGDAIRIKGLAEFNRNLRKMDAALPKALRLAMNEASSIVVDYARPKIPRRSGRAAGSVRVAPTRTAVRVRAGGARVPYYPWLDFGGKVGRGRSVTRPYYSDGRYLWKGLAVKRSEFEAVLTRALLDVARSAGIEVD